MGTAGYCYFCDQPAASDPCPECGKSLHTPDTPKGERKPDPAPALLTPDVVDSGPAIRPWVKWVVAVAVATVIVLILRSPFGL